MSKTIGEMMGKLIFPKNLAVASLFLLVAASGHSIRTRTRSGTPLHPKQQFQLQANPVNGAFCDSVILKVKCKQPPYYNAETGSFSEDDRKSVTDMCGVEFLGKCAKICGENAEPGPECKVFGAGDVWEGHQMRISFPHVDFAACCSSDEDKEAFLGSCSETAGEGVTCVDVIAGGPGADAQFRFAQKVQAGASGVIITFEGSAEALAKAESADTWADITVNEEASGDEDETEEGDSGIVFDCSDGDVIDDPVDDEEEAEESEDASDASPPPVFATK